MLSCACLRWKVGHQIIDCLWSLAEMVSYCIWTTRWFWKTVILKLPYLFVDSIDLCEGILFSGSSVERSHMCTFGFRFFTKQFCNKKVEMITKNVVLSWFVNEKLKKTLWSLVINGIQLPQDYRVTMRRQFTFYH